MTQNTKYLFSVTHCDGDADRVAAPLVLANSALAAGADVLLWLTVDGAELGKRGAADKVAAKASRRSPSSSRPSPRTGGASAFARRAGRPTA